MGISYKHAYKYYKLLESSTYWRQTSWLFIVHRLEFNLKLHAVSTSQVFNIFLHLTFYSPKLTIFPQKITFAT